MVVSDDGADRLAVNRRVIGHFRESRARGQTLTRPILLLTTTGRRSGEARTVPVMYVPHAGQLIVIGSNAGAEADPSWVRNLLVDPRVRVELGLTVVDAAARVTGGDERDHLLEYVGELHPYFLEQQARVDRPFPVVILTRTDGLVFES